MPDRYSERDLAKTLTRPGYRLSRENRPKSPLEPITRMKGGKRPEQPVLSKNQGSGLSQKPRKYGNKPVEVDGRKFASKREAARYRDLKVLHSVGEIGNLVCQWRYPLEVSGVHVCFYIADFVYTDLRTGKTVTEDCKGMRTPIYKLKAKLMFAVYGIKILET